MNEPELKAAFAHAIERDFIIKTDVPGRFLVDDSEVVIDYLLYPRPHLIERGFKPNWFGVEVKSPEGEAAKKAIRVAW
jgi:hypothetical protein